MWHVLVEKSIVSREVHSQRNKSAGAEIVSDIEKYRAALFRSVEIIVLIQTARIATCHPERSTGKLFRSFTDTGADVRDRLRRS
jgi:hypothetical protein